MGTKRRTTWTIPEAAKHPQWDPELKAACVKELSGLKRNKVMEIVRRDSIPPNAPAIMRLRNIVEFRGDGTAKCRTVVVGSRETQGEHYLHSASPMVMAETVLMLISVAAVAGMRGEQFDFYMAFTQSDCEEPDQYIELPDILASLLAEYPDLSPNRGGAFVGRLLKELYGRH